jgi:hypothetical protein
MTVKIKIVLIRDKEIIVNDLSIYNTSSKFAKYIINYHIFSKNNIKDKIIPTINGKKINNQLKADGR